MGHGPAARSVLLLSLALLAGCTTTPGPGAQPGGEGPRGIGGGDYRPATNWKDDSSGPTATFVYVTAMGRRGSAKAAAIVYSSDPSNGHFHRETSPRVTVRRVYKSEMRDFIADLSRIGLADMAWEEQDYDANIGPERAFYMYEEGKRRRVLKDELTTRGQSAFTRVEKRIITLTLR